MTTTPTPLLNGISAPANSFVLPRHKMVYINATKAASTTLRWMIADLAGENFESFYAGVGGEQTRFMGIHDGRQRWKKTPRLNDLPPEELAQISPDNGWFIFAVIRDPYSRLWSAWESKLLLRNVKFMDRYSDQPWLPRVPQSAEQVLEDWRTFVHARPWDHVPGLDKDAHFRSQVQPIKPEGINYTKIYDLRELSSLFSDIHAHLGKLGLDQELYTLKANDTPLRMTAEVLDGGVKEVIEDAYADDFAAFGDRWTIDKLKLAPNGWSSDAIDHAAFHTVANQRIGDLRTEAQRLRRELQAARRKLNQQTKAAADGPQAGKTAPKTPVPAPGTGGGGRTLVRGSAAIARSLGRHTLVRKSARTLGRSSLLRRMVPTSVQRRMRAAFRRSR
ncbi:MAG TPA: sulfotransferase family 2 domain-containing protein [Arthrobacter sp.]|nr:sulfotransferase family 2 domain-containing protein [Arthrobacter sp.]